MKKLTEDAEKQIAELKKNLATKESVEKLNKQVDAFEKDIQDNQKNIEEIQKRMDDSKKKYEKIASELTTKVAALELFAASELARVTKVTEEVIEVLRVVEEQADNLQQKLTKTVRIKVSSTTGEWKRWVLGEEPEKWVEVVSS